MADCKVVSNYFETEVTYRDDDALQELIENSQSDGTLDHFITDGDVIYAGKHLLIDIWGASNLTDIKLMEDVFKETVELAGANLLHIHLHHFTPTYGISGVAVLSESHISVHTWPEMGFAAFDVFMCGSANPHVLTEIVQKAFSPTKLLVSSINRGKLAK